MVATWFLPCSSFFDLLANFPRLSKYSNSFNIIRILSMGLNETLPLRKCDIILDFILDLLSNPIPAFLNSPMKLEVLWSSLVVSFTKTFLGTLCLGNLTWEIKSWLLMLIFFNWAKVSSSSLTRTYRKLFVNIPTLVLLPTFILNMPHPITKCTPKTTIFHPMKPSTFLTFWLKVGILGTFDG